MTFMCFDVLIFGCFGYLAAEQNVLGLRIFHQIVSTGRTKCPWTTILSSDCIYRTNKMSLDNDSFIRLYLAGEQNVLEQQFFHQIVSSGRTKCLGTTILLSDFVLGI
ncbi:uncharacterized protein [Atheta coriaria]|uniref:uncharacterized protein isoform X2 n=1 Tax=Dalotia coriaria TaxID=877792 RepID=UPI0031F3FD3F